MVGEEEAAPQPAVRAVACYALETLKQVLVDELGVLFPGYGALDLCKYG